MTQTAKQLLVFGCGLPVICAVLGWRQFATHGPTPWVFGFAGVAAVVLLLTLFKSPALQTLFKYWMKVVQVIGTVITTVILTALYGIVFTPVALVLRLRGKDYLRLRCDAKATSYWLRKDKNGQDTQQF